MDKVMNVREAKAFSYMLADIGSSVIMFWLELEEKLQGKMLPQSEAEQMIAILDGIESKVRLIRQFIDSKKYSSEVINNANLNDRGGRNV
jgi:hypothetical protein